MTSANHGRAASEPDGHPTFYLTRRCPRPWRKRSSTRLKLPTAVVREVTHLIAHHMFNYQEEWSDAAVRRLIARVGEEKIDDIIALRRADQIGMCRENAAGVPRGAR